MVLSASSSAPATASFRRLIQAGRKLLILPFLFTLFFFTFDMRHWMAPPVFISVSLAIVAGAYVLKHSDFRTFVFYIAFFNLFNGLRTFADNTGMRISYDYPVRFDTAIFGAEPNAWLQAHFYHLGSLNVLGWATLAVYTTYFTGHFFVAVALWRFKREWLGKFVAAIVIALYVGLIGYFLIPTAPPWLASLHGDTPKVVRVTEASQDQVLRGAYARGSRIAGENDVGAMPSLHAALTVIVALTAMRFSRRLGILGILYALAMDFSLVYLGEHYVADIVVGSVISLVVWRAVYRPREAVEESSRRLVSPTRGRTFSPTSDEA